MISKPMLAEKIKERELKNLKGYVLEPKYDGSRNIFLIDFDKEELIIKRRNSRTNIFERVPDYQFPEFNITDLSDIFSKDVHNVIIDGEMIARDFASLMNRTHLIDEFKIQIAMRYNPLSFVVFDVLLYNGKDLTTLPYSERRKILIEIIKKPKKLLKVVDVFTKYPTQTFKTMLSRGFEGIIAKRIDSRYTQHRTRDWLKCKRHETETVEILDYDKASKSRPQKNISIKVPVLNLITKIGRVTVPLVSDQDYFYAHNPKFVEVEFQELSKERGKMRFPKFVRFM